MRHLLLVTAALAAPAIAQTAQGDVAVTIYNDDLALIQDTRQIALPAQRSRQEFPDVSGQIRPETVTLSGDGIEIVEQNFDFDLLSPAKLMEKAVGQQITLVRTNPATGAETRESATVLAVNGGVVLRIGNRIEVLRDDSLPVRVIFDKVPENLRARPTLSFGDARKRPIGHTAADPQLSDAGNGLEGRLRHLVRRARGQDRRPGLGDADQQYRDDLQ
jgi:hypothetical protein